MKRRERAFRGPLIDYRTSKTVPQIQKMAELGFSGSVAYLHYSCFQWYNWTFKSYKRKNQLRTLKDHGRNAELSCMEKRSGANTCR